MTLRVGPKVSANVEIDQHVGALLLGRVEKARSRARQFARHHRARADQRPHRPPHGRGDVLGADRHVGRFVTVEDELWLAAGVTNDERQACAAGESHHAAHIDSVPAKVRDQGLPEAVAPNCSDDGGPHTEAGQPGRDVGRRSAELAAKRLRDRLRPAARACLEDIP